MSSLRPQSDLARLRRPLVHNRGLASSRLRRGRPCVGTRFAACPQTALDSMLNLRVHSPAAWQPATADLVSRQLLL